MKRCPECYQVYEGTGIFCENDGQQLLDLPALVVKQDDLVPDIPSRNSTSTSVATALAGVLIGVVLCGGAYVAYSLLRPEETTERARQPFEAQLRETSQPRPAPARSIEAAPTPSESPSPEPEADASPEPVQPQAETVTPTLNLGPVSTGESASQNTDSANVKTIIEMQDGSIVEVDAAWKDGQGVWYRRGGLVSFVESPRVKSITARAEPKSSPSANQ